MLRCLQQAMATISCQEPWKDGRGLGNREAERRAGNPIYDGKPLYFDSGDKKKGEKTGDGIGGIWHIVSE